MELKEMIKVMQHYENGGDVELRKKYDNITDWEECNPLWNWREFDYRIKKQKVTIETWLCQDVGSGEYFIYESSKIDLYIKETNCTVKVKLIESYEIEL